VIYGAATAAILVTMLLALVRAYRGPTVFDRVQAVNMMGTKTVLLIAVWDFLSGRPEWLDVAILYALMNFIGMIALLRFSRFGDLSGDTEVLVTDSGRDAGDGAKDTGGQS
jgi:multicomponent Na+:H+ antiporter subunit F